MQPEKTVILAGNRGKYTKFRLVFNPEQIAMLDGFPRREYGSILLKFYIILPHSAEFITKQQRPLLPRQVVSGGHFRGDRGKQGYWNSGSYVRPAPISPRAKAGGIDSVWN